MLMNIICTNVHMYMKMSYALENNVITQQTSHYTLADQVELSQEVELTTQHVLQE